MHGTRDRNANDFNRLHAAESERKLNHLEVIEVKKMNLY